MDEVYEKKEAARLALVAALEAYRTAAEEYDLSQDGMIGEIENALDDAGFVSMMLVPEAEI